MPILPNSIHSSCWSLNVWGLYILVTRITLVWPSAMVSHFHTRAYLPSDGHPYFATYGRNMQAGNLMSCANLILPSHLGIENYFVFRTEENKKKKRFSGSLSWQVSKCLNFCWLCRWINNQLSIVCCFLWYFQELCAIYFWFVVTVLLKFIKLQKLSLTESFLNAIPAANDGSQLSLKDSLHN